MILRATTPISRIWRATSGSASESKMLISICGASWKISMPASMMEADQARATLMAWYTRARLRAP